LSPTVKRPYQSPRRTEQARQTRRAILQAARQLFAARGYAATSLAQVAEDAGVALKTVQAIFGTKRSLLVETWHLAIAGDDEGIPVAEREWFAEVLGEPDPVRQVELVAVGSGRVKSRAGDMMEVLRQAASADPQIADLWRQFQDEFLHLQTQVVKSLTDKGALLEGVSVSEGADLLWSLNHPSLYHLLVNERGWAIDRYVTWLRDALVAQLLAPGSRAGSDGAAKAALSNRASASS
jgi:AcrR family transcriptional regulator